MGAKAAFSEDLADFSGIHRPSGASKGNKIFISDIILKWINMVPKKLRLLLFIR